MGGVDFLDRVISHYRICVRTKKVDHMSYNVLYRDFAITASWIEHRRHKAMSSAPKSDYLALRIKIQEYLFHGFEEGDASEYEPSELKFASSGNSSTSIKKPMQNAWLQIKLGKNEVHNL
ncbi:hypothetical protein NPIL_312011 [Nephila pilipes]|uniref:Uncharacterized protein n=1 Tax=Nephila pilipes TaxID=299642 RepID=A0A8X6TKB2_NEPPI|nr:hypothetical protein NPIL_312011 [Nephila pilipes]